MTEPSPKRVRFDNEGTPRRHRRSTRRRLAVTAHGDGEAYSSPTLVRRPLAFRMIRNSPVRRAIQNSVTVFKIGKAVRKPTHLVEHRPSLNNTSSEPKMVSGSDFTHGQPLTATSPEQLVCKG